MTAPVAAAGYAGAAAAWPAAAPAFRLPSLPVRFGRVGRRSPVAVPMARRLPRFLGTGLALAFFAGVGLAGSVIGGQYDTFRATVGEPHHALARALGFGIERVDISGIARLTGPEILDAAGINPLVSLAFLDVTAVRERLEQVPLIESASVRKLYPNELVVTLVERRPYALWQHSGELFVVSADGTVIDRMRDERFASLPLVVGESANTHTAAYLALLEAAGPLKNRIKAGTLVAGRRWTLKTDTGIDLRLPETGAAEAIARLVKLEREQKILDRDVLAIDLRMSDRVVVRLTEEAMIARQEANKKKPLRGKGVDT